MPNRKQRRAAAREAGTLTMQGAAPAIPIDIPEPGRPFPTLESISPSVSAAQLATNQANAQHSSGPVSDAGRAISSQNRLTHGLTRHNNRFQLLEIEDPAAYDKLKLSLEQEHQPLTETERLLVNDMAESAWLKERAQRLLATTGSEVTGGVIDIKMFALYLRYETTHRNNFHKSLNQLMKLRAERNKLEIGFEAQKIKAEAHEMKKDKHYWEVLHKDAKTCHQIGLNTAQNLEALAKNPDFTRAYEAELAKFGLNKGDMGVAQAA